MSGLVALSWAPEFEPHAIALIGRCIVDGNRGQLEAVWTAFECITAGSDRNRSLDGDWSVPELLRGLDRYVDRKKLFEFEPDAAKLHTVDRYRRNFEWTEQQHEFLSNAWRKWLSDYEHSSDMLDVIQVYLAIARVLSGSQSAETNAIIDFALSMVNERMFKMDPSEHEEWPQSEAERLAHGAFWASKGA
jgi:hypothetical protein